MWGSNETDSEVRFGGYNEELFKANHSSQTWIDTIDN